ncbi:TVP38/TMEM64 family protein [Mariniblastus fucicola]|uniref:TVP38/TMEM64 family membrane protein n=1 Tax=Mariniblastus fucicola TaxID=980251 RepID=A0A5B9PIQ3_9BACT|nr:VTT domain-containing protein [Mariniblastus fucicola]QEG24542.1 TVP38/TMEM64 family inner membrane protein YdjZ [Mariniblastus fucicola]
MNSSPTIKNDLNANSGSSRKLILLGVVAFATLVAFWFSRQYLSIEFLAEKESALKSFYQSSPALVIAIAFLIYVVVTGLSIPGAVVLSLVYAWFFGFPISLVLISFASTTGATMAFLISRYLFRDWIESKFGEKLADFSEALDEEGAFYLFTLRLVPAVPFFVINAVMGLTRLKTFTFWWVSQLGMLAGTAMYCYAGSRIPSLKTISEDGLGAVFTSSQIIQLTIAFALLGVFPLAVKKLTQIFRSQPVT